MLWCVAVHYRILPCIAVFKLSVSFFRLSRQEEEKGVFAAEAICSRESGWTAVPQANATEVRILKESSNFQIYRDRAPCWISILSVWFYWV